MPFSRRSRYISFVKQRTSRVAPARFAFALHVFSNPRAIC
ncbi:unnamed protein product [Chondrus crispus]|uniref:Uncharacterized protein n=1 Tax=Chondrus crispus TaxID=2769 RepID=R7QSN2_CHOCR|nr:unnamed protein product [Chondrus crispus]CDF40758.1 unnamed protein product [Chondrus crispus]|eukprot:XP_005711052.1 unnamed protein product [Chondrus crispus]